MIKSSSSKVKDLVNLHTRHIQAAEDAVKKPAPAPEPKRKPVQRAFYGIYKNNAKVETRKPDSSNIHRNEENRPGLVDDNDKSNHSDGTSTVLLLENGENSTANSRTDKSDNIKLQVDTHSDKESLLPKHQHSFTLSLDIPKLDIPLPAPRTKIEDTIEDQLRIEGCKEEISISEDTGFREALEETRNAKPAPILDEVLEETQEGGMEKNEDRIDHAIPKEESKLLPKHQHSFALTPIPKLDIPLPAPRRKNEDTICEDEISISEGTVQNQRIREETREIFDRKPGSEQPGIFFDGVLEKPKEAEVDNYEDNTHLESHNEDVLDETQHIENNEDCLDLLIKQNEDEVFENENEDRHAILKRNLHSAEESKLLPNHQHSGAFTLDIPKLDIPLPTPKRKIEDTIAREQSRVERSEDEISACEDTVQNQRVKEETGQVFERKPGTFFDNVLEETQGIGEIQEVDTKNNEDWLELMTKRKEDEVFQNENEDRHASPVRNLHSAEERDENTEDIDQTEETQNSADNNFAGIQESNANNFAKIDQVLNRASSLENQYLDEYFSLIEDLYLMDVGSNEELRIKRANTVLYISKLIENYKPIAGKSPSTSFDSETIEDKILGEMDDLAKEVQSLSMVEKSALKPRPSLSRTNSVYQSPSKFYHIFDETTEVHDDTDGVELRRHKAVSVDLNWIQPRPQNIAECVNEELVQMRAWKRLERSSLRSNSLQDVPEESEQGMPQNKMLINFDSSIQEQITMLPSGNPAERRTTLNLITSEAFRRSFRAKNDKEETKVSRILVTARNLSGEVDSLSQVMDSSTFNALLKKILSISRKMKQIQRQSRSITSNCLGEGLLILDRAEKRLRLYYDMTRVSEETAKSNQKVRSQRRTIS